MRTLNEIIANPDSIYSYYSEDKKVYITLLQGKYFNTATFPYSSFSSFYSSAEDVINRLDDAVYLDTISLPCGYRVRKGFLDYKVEGISQSSAFLLSLSYPSKNEAIDLTFALPRLITPDLIQSALQPYMITQLPKVDLF